MKLTKEIIQTLLPISYVKCDGMGNDIIFGTLPNGVKLGGDIIHKTHPTKSTILYGLDDFLKISNKDELIKIISMSYNDLLQYVYDQHNSFNLKFWRKFKPKHIGYLENRNLYKLFNGFLDKIKDNFHALNIQSLDTHLSNNVYNVSTQFNAKTLEFSSSHFDCTIEYKNVDTFDVYKVATDDAEEDMLVIKFTMVNKDVITIKYSLFETMEYFIVDYGDGDVEHGEYYDLYTHFNLGTYKELV